MKGAYFIQKNKFNTTQTIEYFNFNIIKIMEIKIRMYSWTYYLYLNTFLFSVHSIYIYFSIKLLILSTIYEAIFLLILQLI